MENSCKYNEQMMKDVSTNCVLVTKQSYFNYVDVAVRTTKSNEKV